MPNYISMKMISEPLFSERLKFRKPKISDLENIYEYASDADVTKYVSWKTIKRKSEVKDFIARCRKSWKLQNSFPFVIELDNKFIGMIEVEKINEESFKVGYILNKRVWGKGYATEALARIILFTRETFHCKEIIADCHVENISSQKVLLKNGFKPTETAETSYPNHITLNNWGYKFKLIC